MLLSCLRQMACRAEGRRRRVPDLGRGEAVAVADLATDDEDTAVELGRGRVAVAWVREPASLGERARLERKSQFDRLVVQWQCGVPTG